MDKKKFLFVSYDALITDTAWQVLKEGHQVKYYIQGESSQAIGDGFVPKVKDWRAEIDWADVIVFDDVLGHGKLAQEVRKNGKLAVGGTEYTDNLEDSRSFGQDELKRLGIPIIPFQEFTSFDEAIKFVESNPSRYVIKPSGEAQNIKRLLFVGEENDGRDVIHVLKAYKNVYSDRVKIFQMQSRVTGIEVAVGAFFNGHQFVHPININSEHKRLFPGNLGSSVR